MKKVLFHFMIMFILYSCAPNSEIFYAKGIQYLEIKDYYNAKKSFENILEIDKNYKDATILSKLADSLYNIQIDSINKSIELEKLIEYKKDVRRQIDLFKIDLAAGFDLYQENLKGINAILNKIDNGSNVYNKKENYDCTTITKELLELKLILERFQTIAFPELRKRFEKYIRHTMWLENIETKIGGKKNTALEFKGAIYYSNKTVEDSMNAIRKQLERLRFKKVTFRGSDHHGLIYTFDTSSDSTILNE